MKPIHRKPSRNTQWVIVKDGVISRNYRHYKPGMDFEHFVTGKYLFRDTINFGSNTKEVDFEIIGFTNDEDVAIKYCNPSEPVVYFD